MLGLLHKVTLKQCHHDLQELFPPAPSRTHTHATRLATQRHNKQLLERCDGSHTELTARSLFGLVLIYNLLPQHVVDSPNVKNFQTLLTNAAKQHCLHNAPNWKTLYSPRHAPHENFYTLDYSKPLTTHNKRRQSKLEPRRREARETLRRQARADAQQQQLPLALA